jgi:hypothetical protein
LEELERLGEPIRFPHERGGEAQEPYRGPVAHEGLNVELAEGGVLTYEQFQVLLATGGYHGECVELESGAFIPRERYEELLASGEYVELDDGTPVSASDYAVLTERVRVELEREEAARRRAEDPSGELGEQVQVATALHPVETDRSLHAGLPGWWEELSRDLAESEGACIDTEAVRRYRLLLQEALAPQLYRLLARPVRTEDALCFALELSSLCSGWVLTFEKTAQVEKLLALLKAQLGADEQSQQPESALS